MKVALVHDYIKEYGGAERVLEALHEMYPEAPVYTLIYAPQFLGPHRERFKTIDIRPSFLNMLPFSYKFISIFRLIAPWVFKTFDFSGYDVVIVSATGAYSPNMIRTRSKKQEARSKEENNKPFHICYCHTPPRYLYGYPTAREWKKHIVFRILGEIANHFLRIVDYTASKNVDVFIANSENVKWRIQKFYRRDAVVVYPPAIQGLGSSGQVLERKDTKSYNLKPKTYFLAGGRLARPKHFDLIIKAFGELGLPLKVFGKGFGGYGEELRSMTNFKFQISNDRYYSSSGAIAKSRSAVSVQPSSRQARTINNIEFLGEVTDEDKLELMRGAKAFVIAAEEEDFGIVPVEAMSVGTPVIAYHSGGLVESIAEGKTGMFFDKLSVDSLKAAVKKFQKVKFNPKDCIQQAEKFSKERFTKEIQKVVKNISS